MSYTKQTWQTGDTITAEKLNHIEDGVDDASRQLSDVSGEVTDTQGMLATVEATATASKNYSVGDLLVYDGKLYKVMSAIATGATIIVGSNVAQTTVERQIASGGGGGTTDYAKLSNKPTINNVELSGNKTLNALGINAGSIGFDESETYTDGSIGAEVSNQKNAFASQEGIAKKVYSVASGSSHGASDDKMEIGIKTGQTFSVYMKTTLTANLSTQIRAYYSDGTSEKIFDGTTPKKTGNYEIFTAVKDIVELGFFSDSSTSDYVFTVFVCADTNLVKLYSNLLDYATNDYANTVNKQQSIAKSRFGVLPDTNHSSNNDVCYIKALTGETIGIYVESSKSSTTYIQVFVKNTDGTSTKIYDGMITGSYYFTYTLLKDINGIGYYCAGYKNIAYNFTAFVATSTSVAEILGNVIQNSAAWTNMIGVQNLLIDNQFVREKVFTVAANTAHSSASDMVMLPIAQGETFTINLNFACESSTFNPYVQLYAKRADGTTPSPRIAEGYYCNINYKELTAEYGIAGIGVNLTAQTYAYTCTVSVAKAKTGTDVFKKVYGEADEENTILTSGKVKSFSALFNGSTDVDTYIFFTDPHILGGYDNLNKALLEKVEGYFKTLSKYAEAISTDTIICGGDWLNQGDTKVIACYKLRLIDGLCRKYFGGFNYHNLFGNHDDNYQGKADASSAVNTGLLTQQTTDNILYHSGKAYYRFDTPNTTYFCLDTGTDKDTDMNSYRWEQIDWLCNQLLTETKQNIIVAMHIFANQGTVETFTNYITPMANNVVSAIEAFNAKTSVTLNGRTYTFPNDIRVVRCVLTGHTHFDYVDGNGDPYITSGGIPVIFTTDATNYGANPIRFDMGFLDYTAGKLYLFRVNHDEDREITLYSRS